MDWRNPVWVAKVGSLFVPADRNGHYGRNGLASVNWRNIASLTPVGCEAAIPSGLRRERSPRAYDGGVNVVGEPKSHDFRLSQALAYGVVKKGGCGDFILCGLSPPVLEGRPWPARYTF